jgi:hypothetical protein
LVLSAFFPLRQHFKNVQQEASKEARKATFATNSWVILGKKLHEDANNT